MRQLLERIDSLEHNRIYATEPLAVDVDAGEEAIANTQHFPEAQNSESEADTNNLLTLDEAYQLAKQRGFKSSKKSFSQKFTDFNTGRLSKTTFNKFRDQVMIERVDNSGYRDLLSGGTS